MVALSLLYEVPLSTTQQVVMEVLCTHTTTQYLWEHLQPEHMAGDDGGVVFVGRADSEVRIHNGLFTDNNAIDQGGITAIVASKVTINKTNTCMGTVHPLVVVLVPATLKSL